METIKDPETPILIVDDSTQYTQVLMKILKNVMGYKNITTVDETSKAYDIISSDPEKFRLIFVDFRFPSGQTGGDLLSKLALNSLMKDKVAFLITSEPTLDNVKQASAAGAFGVVAKPFDREQLVKQIDKAERVIAAEKEGSF
jgi:DNA-binding NtrC family response regulator